MFLYKQDNMIAICEKSRHLSVSLLEQSITWNNKPSTSRLQGKKT